MKQTVLFLLVFIFTATSVWAQKKVAIMPLQSIGLDESATVTTESLLKMELQKLLHSEIILIPYDESNSGCFEEKCAIDAGKNVGANEVILCRLSRLGEKVIVQFIHLDVKSGQTILSDNTTSNTIEDMDTVIKRVAMSINRGQPIAKTAEVGTITEREDKKPLRRAAHKSSGFSFGYVYPQEGYDNVEDSFTLDFRAGYDTDKWAVGMLFAGRKGFATNIYAHYLTTRTDICPYFGGAFGFHWVSHENSDGYWDQATNEYIEEKRDADGFEVTVSGGIRLFRTYNFQIMANLDYAISFNDYDDKALVFTLGLLR
ncbi:MAG: hypothetical protein DWQ05_01640 [Calditrichaeota bacterium]|nr:MAG: hypothetical protein DWQ05_01640 [Calditrichota bacterium]